MVYSWQNAQVREKAFYDRIYKYDRGDIASYRPFTPERCIAFAEKTVERFGYTMDAFKGRVVADIGCGPHGIISGLELYATDNDVLPARMYGVDPLMDTYREYGVLKDSRVTYLMTAKGEEIPLENESCDCVFCTNAVDHVERPEAVIREANRICRKGGAFCMSVHVVNPGWCWSRPFLFLVDTNHPHHFLTRTILGLAARYFDRATLCRRVTVVEDHPEFTFTSVLRSEHRLRALKRWASNVILSSVYIRCEK